MANDDHDKTKSEDGEVTVEEIASIEKELSKEEILKIRRKVNYERWYAKHKNTEEYKKYQREKSKKYQREKQKQIEKQLEELKAYKEKYGELK